MIDCLAEYLCNSELLTDINDDCSNPMFSGMDARAFIFNKADIEDVLSDGANSNIIRDITLSAGKRGFYIVNNRNNPYTGTNITLAADDYRNTFTRTVSLFIPMDGAGAVSDIINPLANGKFVVVLKNDFVNNNGDNEFMIMGLDRGLKVSSDGGSLQQVKYENNDYWIVELQESGVPSANKFFIYSAQIAEQYTDDTLSSFNAWTRNSDADGFELLDDGTVIATISDSNIMQNVGGEYIDGIEESYYGIFQYGNTMVYAGFDSDPISVGSGTAQHYYTVRMKDSGERLCELVSTPE